MSPQNAAIVTVGTELTEGLRLDTNSREIAAALSGRGYDVLETVSVGDDEYYLAETLSRLGSNLDLVIVTGGLGPTHDDVTRTAAARALGLALTRDAQIEAKLQSVMLRHNNADARAQVLTQADVLEGAEVIPATTGTAPGQIVPTPGGLLALLPGPPKEMRGMLPRVLERGGGSRAAVRELGVVGLPESDAQVVAQRVLGGTPGIQLTVLARLGDVRVLLLDRGGSDAALDEALDSICHDLGDACYARDGSTLAEVVVRSAESRGVTLATAESCTGGMVAAALTDVPGASEVFLGGVVSYGNAAKSELLGVPPAIIERHGAVSAETVTLMGIGAQERFGADIVVAVSGVAGPGGGTAEKPVGTVWFDAHGPYGAWDVLRTYTGDRETIRTRSTVFALDLMRRQILGLPAPR
jgi:competence/damage-inducible protein CinA-like protein